MERIRLEPGWKSVLKDEFNKDYMLSLKAFLAAELKKKKDICPKPAEFFSAFNFTPIEKLKVVILGQDPYHGPGQAHGLSFSVRPGVSIPPSLVNIYKELKSDLGITPPSHGHLEAWAKQGVFLLNAILSVEAGKAGSHQKRGWEEFTDAVIQFINQEKQNIVFILWGSYAQKKGALIDKNKHFVISSVHPSPLSAHRGFFGSKPFSKANAYLESCGLKPIDWRL